MGLVHWGVQDTMKYGKLLPTYNILPLIDLLDKDVVYVVLVYIQCCCLWSVILLLFILLLLLVLILFILLLLLDVTYTPGTEA